jgi:hypothetical protein
MKRTLWISMGFCFLLMAVVLIVSCGGGGGGGSSPSGNVALYATDDLSGFQQVTATINKVQLVNTGTGDACTVLTTPVTTDIARLSSVLQLLNLTGCPAVNFNRIHMEFSQTVSLTGADNATETCSFTSFKDNNNQPNALQCNSGNCSLDITGAVQVFANQNNRMGLDFVLKDFDVSGSGSNCAATMKVSPLNASDLDGKKAGGSMEGIKGEVSNLNTTAKTFTLTKGSVSLTISYSSVKEQNIDTVLQLAATDNLTVQVLAPSLLGTGPVAATAVFVKIEGTVSNLDTSGKTFTLNFDTGRTITVDFSTATVEGLLANNVAVEVELNGFNGTNFTAINVELSQVEMED